MRASSLWGVTQHTDTVSSLVSLRTKEEAADLTEQWEFQENVSALRAIEMNSLESFQARLLGQFHLYTRGEVFSYLKAKK